MIKWTDVFWKKWFLFLPMIALGCAWVSVSVFAATYNFIFNNPEQGNNSTATATSNPVVTVTDGKTAEAPKTTENASAPIAPEVQAASNSPAPAEAAMNQAAAASQTNLADVKPEAPVSHKMFRLGLDGTYFISGNRSRYEYEPGAALSFTYLPSKYFGLTGRFGAYTDDFDEFYGSLEAEINPLRISLFGLDDLFEIGALVGASSLGAAKGNWVALYGGAKVQANLGNLFSVVATTRANFAYWSTDAGIAFKF